MKTLKWLIVTAALIAEGCKEPGKTLNDDNSKFSISDTIMNMISLDTAKTSKVRNELSLTGKVSFNEEEVVKVYPLVSGLASEVTVSLGDYVKKGQRLAVIKSAEAAGIRNDLLNAQSNLEIAKKALAAAEDMYKSGISSEKEFLTAQSDYKKAESELTRVNDVVKINGDNSTTDYVITAPVAGYIVERFINPHMQIRPDNGNVLFTISDLNHVWVLANVYETDIAKIHAGDEVKVKTIAYPDRNFKGKIDKISTVLDPDNKTMKIRINLNNSNALLKPEMFASVQVTYDCGSAMVEVSSNALIFDKNKNFVVLFKAKNDVQTREVSVFSIVGEKTYLSAGLNPGDKIISKCQLLVYSAMNES
jgi:cobalt-zinc-cadmium efflux system membrane fusion protein